jgi:ParB-like chromosome segregation protein Spo0J
MSSPEVPTIVDVDMALIRPRRYARRTTPKSVIQLEQSIKTIGLQVPIIVRAINDGEATSKKFEILAGRHRYEACRSLKMRTIPCIVQAVDDLQAELITIDENLCRENLTPAQEAKAIARRKEIYEALHPETKHGAIGGVATRVANLATLEKPRGSLRPPPNSPAKQNGTSSALLDVAQRSVQRIWSGLLVLRWIKALNSTH